MITLPSIKRYRVGQTVRSHGPPILVLWFFSTQELPTMVVMSADWAIKTRWRTRLRERVTNIDAIWMRLIELTIVSNILHDAAIPRTWIDQTAQLTQKLRACYRWSKIIIWVAQKSMLNDNFQWRRVWPWNIFHLIISIARISIARILITIISIAVLINRYTSHVFSQPSVASQKIRLRNCSRIWPN